MLMFALFCIFFVRFPEVLQMLMFADLFFIKINRTFFAANFTIFSIIAGNRKELPEFRVNFKKKKKLETFDRFTEILAQFQENLPE